MSCSSLRIATGGFGFEAVMCAEMTGVDAAPHAATATEEMARALSNEDVLCVRGVML